jgi:hypothetical protein
MRVSALILAMFFLGCSGGGKKDTVEGGGGGGGEGGGGGPSGPVTLVSIDADSGSCVAVVRGPGGGENSHAATQRAVPGRRQGRQRPGRQGGEARDGRGADARLEAAVG